MLAAFRESSKAQVRVAELPIPPCAPQFARQEIRLAIEEQRLFEQIDRFAVASAAKGLDARHFQVPDRLARVAGAAPMVCQEGVMLG
jgi:hypothetical protein